MTFRLRDFESDDFNRLHEIDQSCFAAGIAYSRRELAYYLSLRGTFTLVAETNSKSPEIAGFIVAQRRPKGIGHIITIDTVSNFRRHGLGSLLMQAAEERLRSTGCHAIVLEAAVNNASALAFYQRLGYFVLKTIPHYYQDGTDAFSLAKRLPIPHPSSIDHRP